MATSNKSELIVIGNVTEANCKLAFELNHNPWLVGVAVVHVVIAACGLIAMYKYLKTKEIQKAIGLIDINLKIISACGLFYYGWGFVSCFLVYMYKLYLYLRHLEPCDYIWSADLCFVLYSQHVSACTVAYTSFHAVVLIERIYALFYDTSKQIPVFGIVFGLCFVSFPQWWCASYFSYYTTNKMLYDRVYCSSLVHNTSTNNVGFLGIYIRFICFDLIVNAGDSCLLLYNKYRMAKYYQKISDSYTLTKSFSLHEARISIRLIYPFSVAHSFCFLSFSLFYVYYLISLTQSEILMDQFWREFVNLIRTSSMFVFFSVLNIFHRRQPSKPKEQPQNENEADRYFQMFNQMIA
ncbi:hypothetical protein M3Y95_01132800 [Aphelenchoides besseyi]|nr:hypothetical protein M3Y95_01132800 [Aphelenchoides besseyi]